MRNACHKLYRMWNETSAGNTELILEHFQECVRFPNECTCVCVASVIIDNGIGAREKYRFPSFATVSSMTQPIGTRRLVD